MTDASADRDFPNVEDLPLTELIRSKDTALGHAVRRVLEETELLEGNYAAFGNVTRQL